jgi:hypothetical protein
MKKIESVLTNLKWITNENGEVLSSYGEWSFVITQSDRVWSLKQRCVRGGSSENSYPSITAAKRAARKTVNIYGINVENTDRVKKSEGSSDKIVKSLGSILKNTLKVSKDLIKRMAETLAVCHGLLDEKKIKNPDVDMSWIFDDIEKSFLDARILIGAGIPQLPVEVDEEGNEKIIRPF